jgi:hypothetical protein
MERQARRTPSDKFRLAVRHNHRILNERDDTHEQALVAINGRSN